jgi:hypothetical protein
MELGEARLRNEIALVYGQTDLNTSSPYRKVNTQLLCYKNQ